MGTFNKEYELQILIEHYKKASDAKVSRRAHAIALHLNRKSHSEICMFLFCSERTVDRWIKAYKDNGIGSIFPGYYNNENAAKLSREQKEEIRQELKQNPLPLDYWKAPDLKGYLSARFDVEYESKESYCALLRFCNYSYKLPDLYNIKRDEKYVKKRMKEIKAEIKPLLKDPDWCVLAADESRIEWRTLKRRAWLNKGEKTVIKERQGKLNQNYIGFLDVKTGRDNLYRLEWQNQEEVIVALRKLREDLVGKKLCIIWDNAKFHRGQKIRDLLGKGNEFEYVKLLHLPPYAPDKNPQEHVWKQGKDYIANSVYNKFEDLRADFEEIITQTLFDYKF